MDEGPISRIEWLERFARRLMELRPAMNSITAATHAVEAHRTVADAVPEVEAVRLAEERYPLSP